MREHDEKNCNINDMDHKTPPKHDCGHNVMEGPAILPDGSLLDNPDSQTVRKDSARFGPGMRDEQSIPKSDMQQLKGSGKVIRSKKD